MRQIDYVSTTALTPINLEPYTEHGGGGFKKIVSVAAVIAIPIAAPIIASSVAMSAGLGTLAGAGLIAGSALAGGLMGAAVGSYTGQGMKQGALMGALSGGLAGYMQGRPTTTTPVDGSVADASQISSYGPDPLADPAAVNYDGLAAGENIAAGDSFVANTRPDGMGASIGDRLSGSGVTTNAQGQQILTAPDGKQFVLQGEMAGSYPGQEQFLQSQGIKPVQYSDPNIINASFPGQTMANSASTTAKLKDFVAQAKPDYMFGDNLFGQTAAEIGSRFTNPSTLADVSIQAGINLIGAELLGVGDMSDEEKENLRLQKEQMERLKERDEKAYNFAMKTAREFYRLGENFDPEQIARQAYGKATRTAGIAARDALRKISPNRAGLRAAEERRFALGTAANAGSAYDRGMIQGLNQKANYLQKASATFPNQGGSYSAALTGLAQTQANLARKRSEAQKGVNQMFGGFLTRPGDGNRSDDYRAGLRDAFGSFITARS